MARRRTDEELLYVLMAQLTHYTGPNERTSFK